MQYRLKLASSTFALVIAAGTAEACGHLPFEELPADGLDGAVGPFDGAGPFLDGGGVADGFVQRDARFDDDAAPDVGPPPLDGSVPCTLRGDCNIIYVSRAVGRNDPAADGTFDRPMKTIQAALGLVQPGERDIIVVSADTYDGPVVLNGGVNVQIKGGYECSSKENCSWTPTSEETILTTGQFSGALVVNDSITSATVIKNLHIKGRRGGAVDVGNVTGTFAVAIYGGTPTLEQLTIDGTTSNGGTGRGARSAALFVGGPPNRDTGVRINDCTITGGIADDVAVGILVENLATGDAVKPSIVLTKSRVSGGNARVSAGVLLAASSKNTTITDNVIQAAATKPNPNDSALVPESWAIALNGSGVIERNLINQKTRSVNGGAYCNSTKSICGGIELSNADATVQNNIIAGLPTLNSAAVRIFLGPGSLPGKVVLNGNLLEAAGDSEGGSVSAAISLRNENGSIVKLGNIRNNIMNGGRGNKTYGVYEETTAGVNEAHFLAFDHNAIEAAFVYRTWRSGTANDIKFTDIPITPAIGISPTNFQASCPLDANFRLLNLSPCINKGTDIEAPPTDYEGDGKPINAKWDIGPDESTLSPKP